MITKIKLTLAVIVIVLGIGGVSFAMSCHGGGNSDPGKASAQDEGKALKAADAGNKTCPVTGETIKESTKATIEYKGKNYNLCCPMCTDEFKKDPVKYSAIAEQATEKQ